MYKVLFVNNSNMGSTGAIINSIGKLLDENGWVSVLCIPYKVKKTQQWCKTYSIGHSVGRKINRIFAKITGMPFGFAPLATARLKKIIRKEKPDIVHLHCPNGYMVNLYSLIAWLNKNNLPTVLTNHCEIFYTANCAHSYDCVKWETGCGNCKNLKREGGYFLIDRTRRSWEKLRKSFHGFKNIAVVSVSKWVFERSCASPILGQFPNYVVENGVDDSIYFYKNNFLKSIDNGLSFDKLKNIVLFVVAAFTDEKGKNFFLDIVKRFKDTTIFILVGAEPNVCDLPKNVINLGRISDAFYMAGLYSMADATLVLSKKETFSMVTAESLSCGTPVVGFYAGGPESIAIEDYSYFCKYGDIDSIEHILQKVLKSKMPKDIKEYISVVARKKYSIRRMSNSYMKIYNDLLCLPQEGCSDDK